MRAATDIEQSDAIELRRRCVGSGCMFTATSLYRSADRIELMAQGAIFALCLDAYTTLFGHLCIGVRYSLGQGGAAPRLGSEPTLQVRDQLVQRRIMFVGPWRTGYKLLGKSSPQLLN